LSGFTAYDRAESYVTKPVVQDVKKGMTRQQVRDIAATISLTQSGAVSAVGGLNARLAGNSANTCPGS